LVLGAADPEESSSELSTEDQRIDSALQTLYGEQPDGHQRGGLGASAPRVARWLGDVRSLFPKDVVRVMQKDAFDRLGLAQMLLEPEMLEAVEPDVDLVATLLSLKHVIPDHTKDTARQVVRKVVDDLIARLEQPLRDAIVGTVDRSQRRRRPKLKDIDWGRTVQANLRHYQPELRTVIPERLVGFGRRRAEVREVILCVDQSGSMAKSVIYSGVFAAVLASLPSVKTHLVVFDTSVVDLTEELHEDPVDLLFGVQLGGGTDIDRALGYVQGLVTRPEDTILVLITDLYEGGNRKRMIKRMGALAASGVNCVTLLSLDDAGAPWFDKETAAEFAAFGVPSFACTPALFPQLMAAALKRKDLAAWASENDVVTTRGPEEDLGL
jgi:hypothetical protein